MSNGLPDISSLKKKPLPEASALKKKDVSTESPSSGFQGQSSLGSLQTPTESLGQQVNRFRQEAVSSYLKDAVNSGFITEEQIVSSPESSFDIIAEAKYNSPDYQKLAQLTMPDFSSPEFQDFNVGAAQEKIARGAKKGILMQDNAKIAEQVKQKVLETIPEEQRTKENIDSLEEELWQKEGVRLNLNPEEGAVIGESEGIVGMAKDAVLSFQKGVENMALSAAANIQEAKEAIGIPSITMPSASELSDLRKEELDRLSKKITQYEGDILSNVTNGNWDDAFGLAIQQTSESLPLMVASSMTSNPYTAFLSLSGVSASQHYQDVKDEEWFKKLSPAAKSGYLATYGGAEGLDLVIGGAILKRAARSAANGKAPAKEAIKQFFKGMGYDVSEEAASEGVTGVIQYVADMAAQGKDIDFEGIKDSFVNNAVSGAAGGGIMSGGARAVGRAKNITSTILGSPDFIKLRNKEKELKENLQNATSQEEVQILAATIDEVQRAKNNLVKDNRQLFESMSEEDQNNMSRAVANFNTYREQLSKIDEKSPAYKLGEEQAQKFLQEITDIKNKYEGVQQTEAFSETEQPTEETQPTKTEEDAIQERKTTEVPSEPRAEGIQEMEEEVRGEQEGEGGTQEGGREATQQAQEQEVTKPLAKSIASKAKAVNKRFKKAVGGSVVDNTIREFTSLPLNRITDAGLAKEVESTLKDINARKISPDKIQDLTSRVSESLDTEAILKDPKNYKPENLQRRVDDLDSRVDNVAISDFNRETLRNTRSRSTRLLSSFNELSQIAEAIFEKESFENNDQAQANYQDRLSKIQAAKDKLETKLEQAGINLQEETKSLNEENKKLSKSITPPKLDNLENQQVNEFLDAVSDFEATDLYTAIDVQTLLDDIDNGVVLNGEMSRIKNSALASEVVSSDSFQEIVENVNSAPKQSINELKSFFQWFNPMPKSKSTLKEWVSYFRNHEYAQWDNILGVGKTSPIYTKILDPIIRVGEQYRVEVSDEMSQFFSASKFPMLSKDVSGKERIKAVSDYVSEIISPKQVKSRITVGMVMLEDSFKSKWDESLWSNVMNKTEEVNKLDKKNVKYYKEVYESLPKNADGSIDVEKAIQGFDRKQKSMYDFLSKKFEENGELAKKQEIANQKNNQPFERRPKYVPFMRIGEVSRDSENLFSDVGALTNPKIASDRGKEIKDSKPSMMIADPMVFFSDYVHQVNRDYYMTDPIRAAYKFFNKAIENSQGEVVTAFTAMKQALKYNVAMSFNDPKSGLFRFTQKMTAAAYAYYLVSLGRSVAEPTVELGRSIMLGDVSSPKKMFSFMFNSAESSIKDLYNRISGITLSDSGEISTTKEFRSDFKKLLQFVNSPYEKQFSRQFSDGNIRSQGKSDNMFMRSTSYIMGLPNRISLWGLWMPAFDNRYKEITGKEFDYSKLNDQEFLNENRKVIKEAGAYANKKTANYKGFTTALGGRTMNKFFFKDIDGLTSPSAFKANQFLSTFGWRESEVMLQSVRDLSLALGDRFTDKDLKRLQATSTNEAIRNVIGSVSMGVAYGMIMNYFYYIGLDDDEDKLSENQKKFKEEFEQGSYGFNAKSLSKETLGYGLFLATSRNGYLSRDAVLIAMGNYTQYLNNMKVGASKEQKKELDNQIEEIKNLTNTYFYTDPINIFGGKFEGATSFKEVLKTIPAAAIPVQFGEDLNEAFKVYDKRKELSQDEEKATLILTYNVIKSFLLASGAIVPFGKETDKRVRKETRELQKQIRDQNTSGIPKIDIDDLDLPELELD